jgi:protein LTV1
MMNEFLDNYEIVGGKMKPVLAGDSAVAKLDTLRKALGEAKIRDEEESDNDEGMLMPVDVDDVKDRWDCETILSTTISSTLLYCAQLIPFKVLTVILRIILA